MTSTSEYFAPPTQGAAPVPTDLVTERLQPTDRAHWLELRAKDITSTESPALFNCLPYATAAEVWHRKRSGNIVEFAPSEPMRWGTALQPAIAAEIASVRNLTIRPMEEYIRIPELRMGSSFDYAVTAPTPAILEIKNVSEQVYRKAWIEYGDGNIEAPPHIEIQVQHQMAVSGFERAYLGALIGGNRLVVVERRRDDAIVTALRKKVAQFWASIDADIPPAWDFERDARLIMALNCYATPEKVLDAKKDARLTALAIQYKDLASQEKEIGEKREAIKAEITEIIKDHEKVTGDGYTISAGMIGPSKFEVNRKGYRDFRITWSKKK